MKNTIFFFILFSFLNSFPGFSQSDWYYEFPLPQGNQLNGVYMVDNSIIYTVGRIGTILKTQNAGGSWIRQTYAGNEDLTSVFFNTADQGFITGANGTLLQTSDGGTHWDSIAVPIATQLNKVYFTDASHGFVLGDSGKLLRTTDGGINWEPVTIPAPSITALYGIHFPSATVGYIVGADGAILKTADAGLSWTRFDLVASNALESVFFLNDTTGFVTGLNGLIFRTTNGGQSWTNDASWNNYSFYTITFQDQNTGYIAGNNGAVLKSTDGGNTWVKMTTNLSQETVFSLSFSSPNHAFGVGTWGTIIKTVNAGVTWETLSTPLSQKRQLSHVQFVDSLVGYISFQWAAGDNDSMLLKSSNGGITWKGVGQGANNTISLYAMHFPSRDTGYISFPPVVERTTDGGTIWNGISPGYPILSLFFTDNEHGIAGGAEGKILHTTDGGITWILEGVSGQPFDYRSVYFPDKITGYIAGGINVQPIHGSLIYSGVLLKTLDGGSSWTIKDIPSNYLYSIHFPTLQTGYACGDGGVVMKTDDSGESWTLFHTSIPGRLIHFTAADTGYVMNGTPFIYKTTDGGNTWMKMETGTQYNLRSISFPNSKTSVVVGDYGTILKNPWTQPPPSGIIISKKQGEDLSVNCFPNPFSDRITFKVNSNNGKEAILRITDQLGREVSGQIHIKLVQGESSYTLTANNFTTGLYIFSLTVDQSVIRGKMIRQ